MDFSNRGPQGHAYVRISPTAWLVAYQRTLSDIPLSKEIFDELAEIAKQTWPASKIEELERLKNPGMPVIWEARYKLVNRLLKEQRVDQILELAAGFSPRGLEMVRTLSVEYVEMDLPPVVDEKRKILERLIARSQVSRQANLHLEAGNALSAQDLFAATRVFKAKPIAIVNEGLLQYLDLDEKEALARSVRQVLQAFGGVWITPDISTQALGGLGPTSEKIRERMAKIRNLTGIDVQNNRFENENAAREFFQDLGFSVERHGFAEVAGELCSPSSRSLSFEHIEKVAGQLVAFVMKVNLARGD